MKIRKRNLGISAVLLVVLLSSSGCERIVRSAVVQEKDADNTEAAAASEENSENQKSVKEQVLAPEIYQAEFSEALGSISDKDPEENSSTEEPDSDGSSDNGTQMQLHLIADAAVEVPDVEVICLKQAKRSIGDTEQMRKWAEILRGDAEAAYEDESFMEDEGVKWLVVDGTVTVHEWPYTYSYTVFQEPEGSDTSWQTPNFYWDLSDDGVLASASWDTGTEGSTLTDEEKIKISGDAAENLLKDLWGTEFRIFDETLGETYKIGSRSSYAMDTVRFRAERMVEGIPVTFVLSGMYPIGTEALETDPETGMLTSEKWWFPESFSMEFAFGRLQTLLYDAPMEVSDYSDEALFLLPFEEIRQIFENTIGDQLIGQKMESLMDYNRVMYMYPPVNQYPSMGASEVEMKITKVKLGYMRIPEDDMQKGLLVPAWDFFGTWKAKVPMEDGSIQELTMEEKNVSLLTIDARDGSIIQRVRGR